MEHDGLPERLARLVEMFAAAPKRVKIDALVDFSDRLPPPPDDLAGAATLHRVHECQTPFFVAATTQPDGRVHLVFDVPRESPTIRGYAGILAEGLEGVPVSEVLAIPDDFYLRMGLEEVLSPLRLRGMGAILREIKRQLAAA